MGKRLNFHIVGLVTVTTIALLTADGDVPIAGADDGTPAVVNCGGQPDVKPGSIILTCADNTWAVDKIVWTDWSAGGAKGTGIEYRRSCVPNCAQGSPTYSPVTITLTGAAPPDFRYTSAVVTNQNTGRSDTSSLPRG
jgi:hypothetical protein